MEFQSFDYDLDDVRLLKDLLLTDNADDGLLYPIKHHSLARRSHRLPTVLQESESTSSSVHSPDSLVNSEEEVDSAPSKSQTVGEEDSTTYVSDVNLDIKTLSYRRSFSLDDYHDIDEENRRDKWIDEFTENHKISLRSATMKLSLAAMWRKKSLDSKRVKEIAPKILERIRSFDKTFQFSDQRCADSSGRRSITEFRSQEKWKKIVRDAMFSKRRQGFEDRGYPSVAYLKNYLRHLLPGVAYCCGEESNGQDIDTLSKMLQSCDSLDWSYDVFKLDSITGGHCLSVLLFIIFEKSGLLGHYNFNIKRLTNFVLAVEARMPKNEYHNRKHVACFLQVLYSQLSCTSGPGCLYPSPVEWLSMIFAAAVHDLDHLGLTNDFLIKIGHEWALLFNDRSVAENHHANAAFMMLQMENGKSSSTNFIAHNLTLEDFRRFRFTVIELILATDMRSHFPIVGNIQVMCIRYEQQKQNSVILEKEDDGFWPLIKDKNDDGDFMNVMKLLMKLSDLSHLSLKTELNTKWVNMLQEEFFKQGDKERSLDMPISFMMDRNKSHELCDAQPGFFEVIAMPLFLHYNQLFPHAGWRMLNQVHKNLDYWKRRSKKSKRNDSPLSINSI